MKKRPILADLHNHLHEKKLKERDWWAAVRRRKLSVIAITEHPYFEPRDAYLRLKAIQPKGVILIPGIEVKTNAGDLLVFGEDETLYDVPELLEINVEAEQALKAVKREKLVASFPHPYGYRHDSICETLGEKKALALVRKYEVGAEYYNGLLGSANEAIFGKATMRRLYGALNFVEKNRATNALRISRRTAKTRKKMEKFAAKTLEKVKKGMLFAKKARFITTGSDAHYPKAIGTGVLELAKMPRNEKDFLKMLQSGKVLYAGPNIYSGYPVDRVTRKEILEGLFYVTKKGLLENKKIRVGSKIRRKIRLGKRIKTMKRITKTVSIKKIRKKLGLGK